METRRIMLLSFEEAPEGVVLMLVGGEAGKGAGGVSPTLDGVSTKTGFDSSVGTSSLKGVNMSQRSPE